ncbi:hypothetical protein GGS21DRAFT_534360 [Xylaria nigripes]|nr:hypothetical protein GGS21DRAFT_534360 [Xylaria nigripes]
MSITPTHTDTVPQLLRRVTGVHIQGLYHINYTQMRVISPRMYRLYKSSYLCLLQNIISSSCPSAMLIPRPLSNFNTFLPLTICCLRAIELSPRGGIPRYSPERTTRSRLPITKLHPHDVSLDSKQVNLAYSADCRLVCPCSSQSTQDISSCHSQSSFPYDIDPSDSYYPLFLADDSKPHGYLRPETVAKMPWTASFQVSHEHPRTVRVLDSSQGSNSVAALTAAFQELVDICVERKTFRIFNGRHSEPFAILSYPSRPRDDGTETGKGIVTVERLAMPLFGIILAGAHMIAYRRSRAPNNANGVISGLWIPRRAKHLISSPGMLDVTVAGGITAGFTALETIIKEAGEEASLSPNLVRTRVQSTGVLTYVGSTDTSHSGKFESGLLCPSIIYTHDIELPEDVVPKPHDGEVEGYTLMNIVDVQAALLNDEFKPDSAIVIIDFFIRHGIINADNERDLIQINEQMHRRLPFRIVPR